LWEFVPADLPELRGFIPICRWAGTCPDGLAGTDLRPAPGVHPGPAAQPVRRWAPGPNAAAVTIVLHPGKKVKLFAGVFPPPAAIFCRLWKRFIRRLRRISQGHPAAASKSLRRDLCILQKNIFFPRKNMGKRTFFCAFSLDKSQNLAYHKDETIVPKKQERMKLIFRNGFMRAAHGAQDRLKGGVP